MHNETKTLKFIFFNTFSFSVSKSRSLSSDNILEAEQGEQGSFSKNHGSFSTTKPLQLPNKDHFHQTPISLGINLLSKFQIESYLQGDQ